MSTRNFDALMQPRSIALIGASNEPGSVGAVLARNLWGGGFSGKLFPVNPREAKIGDADNYLSIAALPEAPDLAVIATPPAAIPGLIGELGQKGCRAAIIISAGGAELRANALNAAQPFLMRLIGPNCLGLMSPAIGLNASFSHLNPLPGDIAFLTQSGAIATSMIDWANARDVGFSHIASLGDMSDVDFGDLLDYLALDSATRSILIYVENVTHARKFMSAGRIAARAKPVLVVKAGRGQAGARAAASHTGSLAGADAVYDAAFRRAGMLRVDTLRDLFDAAETLASGLRPARNTLTIVTNGGGLGVIAADALEAAGGELTALSSEAEAKLNAALPPTWSHNNPIDILGDAHGARYRAVLDVLAQEHDPNAILVMNCPTGVTDSDENVGAVLDAVKIAPHLKVLACWMGGATTSVPRRRLSEAGVPNYETPDEAVRAFMHLVEYRRNQAALLETPQSHPAAPGAHAAAAPIIEAALAEGRTLLTEPEAKSVLEAYGVPVVKTLVAADADAAADAGARIGGAVALKILSRDITHKSDIGGVQLNLVGAQAVKAAAEAMLARVQCAAPHARIDGFTVQAMIRRPDAEELILGVSPDSTFGPVILFGQGGVAVEVIADRAMGLPPLNTALARAMIARTRVSKLLAGYRHRRGADVDAIARALVALSDMIIDLPQIAELDINPLLADAEGVVALDARIVVRRADATSAALSIQPYPRQLERGAVLRGGRCIHIRPIRADDAPALLDMIHRTDRNDLRLRFHGAVRDLDADTAARLSQIDYDREMALIAVEPDGAIGGVARVIFDPNFESGEYALIVRSDLQGQGLGRTLMADTLAYARTRGARRLWGDVLSENANMLTLAREMGAKLTMTASAAELTRSTFDLDARA